MSGTPRARFRRLAGGAATATAILALAACSASEPRQSVLDPQGGRAEPVMGLWMTMFVIGSIVWLIVVVAMTITVVRRRRSERAAGDEGADEPVDAGERRRPFWFVLAAGAIVPAVVIAGITAYSAVVLADIDRDQAGNGTTIEVVGHQYWWEVEYPGLGVTTANEIHIPVGERVRVEVTSADVIHSFWVPELSGKIDMIPGRSNATWLETDEPGTYWGQCAEYCGEQHALMRVVVVAHAPEEFEAWAAAQRRPAVGTVVADDDGDDTSPYEEIEGAPEVDDGDTVAGEEDPGIAEGREIFMSSSCVYCHAIGGTAAQGNVGPDLTHLASRETIAAGVLPNTRGDLAGWLLDPQSIKPGNAMPGTDLEGAELQALLDYLQSLE